jgi:hypothetical protein
MFWERAIERGLIYANGVVSEECADGAHITGAGSSLETFRVGAYHMPMVKQTRSIAVVIDDVVLPFWTEGQVGKAPFFYA